MRARILEASLRVLRDEGALAFTTTRVAQMAGISVGSLYQYFPNKHALVFELHQQNVREGLDHVLAMLGRAEGSPRQKVHEIVRWFFESEVAEASSFGVADGDVAVFLRDGVGDALDAEARVAAVAALARFIEASTTDGRARAACEHAARFAMTTVEAIGKAVAAQEPSADVVRRWADDTASMLADHLAFAP